jgi:hypothetical protein
VLALEPEHKEVRALVASLGRRRELRRRAAWGSGLLGVAVGVGGLAWIASQGPVSSASAPAPLLAVSAGADAGSEGQQSARIAVSALAANTARSASAASAGVEPSAPSLELDLELPVKHKGSPPPRSATAATLPHPRPVAASPDAGPADAALARDPAAPPAPPAPAARAELRLRIGNSFADILLDGVRVRQNFFGGAIELTAGRHTLEVEKPGLGSFRPRTLEVGDDGTLVELTPAGVRRPVQELLFVVPRPGEAAPSDWHTR